MSVFQGKWPKMDGVMPLGSKHTIKGSVEMKAVQTSSEALTVLAITEASEEETGKSGTLSCPVTFPSS